MSTFTKVIHSGSTNGKPVIVAATSTPGTTIHTSIAGTSSLDEIWIYAQNIDTSSRTLTIEFGDDSSKIVLSIPAQQGLVLVVPGLILDNSLVVKAFSDVTNKILIFGFVNRIT